MSSWKILLLLGAILGPIPSNSTGELNELVSRMADKLLAVLNNAAPASSFGEREEFKEFALTDRSNDDSYDSTTQEIIEEAGFKSVTHLVTSPDGYITELVNIINPRADQSELVQPPVIMFHGALIDPSSFIWGSIRQHHPEVYPRNVTIDGPITSSNRSIAFVLANNGYDVWLAGTRGCNKQNLGHTRYKAQLLEDVLSDLKTKPTIKLARSFIDTLKYYEFTQDDLVEIEYPKQIREVLRLTGSSKVSVITYSKSTQVVFKILASDPVLSRRIHSHVCISPILNMVGSNNIWRVIAKLAVNVPNPVGNLIFTQIIETSWLRNIISMLPRYTWASYLLNVITGSNPRYQTNLELPVLGHLFMPLGFTEIKQYCQQILAGKLQKYDHGRLINRIAYNGTETPPEYDLSKIKLKRWMLVSSELDVMSTQDSVEKYYNLINYKPDKWIRVPRSNHIDLSAGFENDIKVNLPILEFMEKFKLPSSI